MDFFTKLTFSPFKYLVTIFKGHISAFYYNLDQVKDYSTLKSNQINISNALPIIKTFNWQYFIPLFTTLHIILDSFYIIASNEFQYSVDNMDELYPHKVLPRAIWPIGDIIFVFVAVMPLLIFSSLFIDSKLKPKYTMVLERFGDQIKITQNNRKILNKKVAYTIDKYRQKMHSIYPYLFCLVSAELEVFCGWNLFTHWIGTLHDVVILILMVLFEVYACFSNIFFIFFFCMTCRYLQIKQNFIKDQMKKLSQTLNATDRKQQKYWKIFKNLLEKVSNLHDEILGANDFWGTYLSWYFLMFTFKICYICYMIFFGNAIYLHKSFFFLLGLKFFFVLNYVTLQCSIIVQNNICIEKKSQMLFRQFAVFGQLQIVDLLKFDRQVENASNIDQISFKLSNDFIIDSKGFEMVFV